MIEELKMLPDTWNYKMLPKDMRELLIEALTYVLGTKKEAMAEIKTMDYDTALEHIEAFQDMCEMEF